MSVIILDEELSTNNMINNETRNTDYFTKTPYFKPTFKILPYTEQQQKFVTMFNFQHSQLTQNEFEKLADLPLKYPKVYATSKLDVGKINSPLHLPLKPDAVFKKQRASKVPFHYNDKANILLEILEQLCPQLKRQNNQKKTPLLTLLLSSPKENP